MAFWRAVREAERAVTASEMSAPTVAAIAPDPAAVVMTCRMELAIPTIIGRSFSTVVIHEVEQPAVRRVRAGAVRARPVPTAEVARKLRRVRGRVKAEEVAVGLVGVVMESPLGLVMVRLGRGRTARRREEVGAEEVRVRAGVEKAQQQLESSSPSAGLATLPYRSLQSRYGSARWH